MLVSIGDVVDMYYQFAGRSNVTMLLGRLMMPAKKKTASWWGGAGHAPRNWWDVPEVVARWNELITGDGSVPYIKMVDKEYFTRMQQVRLLSAGCGEGAKECAIARLFPHWSITAFDMSVERIATARRSAEAMNLSNITFYRIDIDEYTFEKSSFDAVLFDSSLHHFSAFDVLFEKLNRVLAPEGVLVVNEYVGPNRFAWSKKQLAMANRELQIIPEKFRTRYGTASVKRHIYRPGYLRMLLSDPSEAVQSSCILPALHRFFDTIKEVSLGGNLLHLVLKDIAHHFAEIDSEKLAILERLISAEKILCKTEPPDFVFGIYRKR